MGDPNLDTNCGFKKVTEINFLIDIVRSMSRILVGKTHGQEVIWDKYPKIWPVDKLGPWKNPTEKKKDNLDLLKQKVQFLREHISLDQLSESQQAELELYDQRKMKALSDFSNLVKGKDFFNRFGKLVLTICGDELVVRQKETELVDCLETLIHTMKSNMAKRKSSSSSERPAKQARMKQLSKATTVEKAKKQTQTKYRPIQPKLQIVPDSEYGSPSHELLGQFYHSPEYGSPSTQVQQQIDPNPEYGSASYTVQQIDPNQKYGSLSHEVQQQINPYPENPSHEVQQQTNYNLKHDSPLHEVHVDTRQTSSVDSGVHSPGFPSHSSEDSDGPKLKIDPKMVQEVDFDFLEKF